MLPVPNAAFLFRLKDFRFGRKSIFFPWGILCRWVACSALVSSRSRGLGPWCRDLCEFDSDKVITCLYLHIFLCIVTFIYIYSQSVMTFFITKAK